MNNENNTQSSLSFVDKLRIKLNAFAEKINTPFVQRVGNKLISKKHLYPSFGFPVMILLIVYAAIGVFPFGDRSILTLDMNAQYIFYFEQIRDVLVGKSSLIYTFERSLGGEFLGYYAYYLASPLSWIVALFPERLIVEAVTFIMILKCGLSGFFFAYYLEKTGREINMMGYAMFSTMYALCAYAMAYQSNTMWMDALMLLPLVTLGLERLIKDGRFKFFIVTFAITVWSNYYIGYMCCIYVLLYTVCYLCAHKNDEINSLNETKHTVKSILRVGIASLIALLIVATIIFSAAYSLTFGKNEFQDNKFDFELRFDFLDLFAKFFLGSYDTVRPEGSPNVYCGMLTLFMIPLYFISRKVTPRHKVAYGSLCAIFIASFSVNAIDLVWHGFQMPVWLNYRYSFMFTFVLLTMAYRGYEYLKETDFKFIFQIGILLIFTLMFMQKLVEIQRYKSGGVLVEDTMPDYEFIWVSIFFIALYLVFLYFAKNPKSLKQTAASALLVLVLFDTGIGAGMSWGHEVYEVGYAYRNSHVQFLDDLQPTVDEIKERDPSFYRMEKTQYRKNNENLALDINGFASSTSTLNANVIELLHNMGFAANSHWAKYFAGNEIVDSLFGVKYVISDDKTSVSNLYDKSVSADGLPVYTNPYALSIAYAAHPNAKNLILSQPIRISPYLYLEGMLANLTGEKDLKIFENCTYSTSFVKTNNCTKSLSGNGVRYKRSNSEIPASFTYTVTAKRDGCIYMHFLSNVYNKKMTYYVNDEKISTFFDTDTNRIHNIGTFKAGEVITVKFEFDADTISYYTDAPIFVQTNPDTFKAAMDKLDDGNLMITDYSDTRIEGTLTAKDGEFVFTTIPYDKYWRVYVDGERVETYSTMETLLAFDVDAGEHEIKMVYVSMPFYIGLAVSALGIGLFVLFILLERKKGWKLIPVFVMENEEKEAEIPEDVAEISENNAEMAEAEKTTEETNEEQL